MDVCPRPCPICETGNPPWHDDAMADSWMDPAEDPLHESENRETAGAFAPFSTGGVYVNFLGNEGSGRVRAAYGDAKFERLAKLKQTYDPENLFRLNQNIPPARTP